MYLCESRYKGLVVQPIPIYAIPEFFTHMLSEEEWKYHSKVTFSKKIRKIFFRDRSTGLFQSLRVLLSSSHTDGTAEQ